MKSPEQGLGDPSETKIESPEKKSPKIELPSDIETIRKLQKKLREYKTRLEEEKGQKIKTHTAPEQDFVALADTHYKIAVLEKLLLEGSVNTYELSRELNEADGMFDASAFDNACGVIEDYVETGGERNVGGTGF